MSTELIARLMSSGIKWRGRILPLASNNPLGSHRPTRPSSWKIRVTVMLVAPSAAFTEFERRIRIAAETLALVGHFLAWPVT
jgi:hypothetical protein